MPVMKFPTLEAIPAELRGEAKQDGTEFAVNVVPASKLAEFRDNNVRFQQERDAALSAINAVKPLIGDDVAKFAAELTELRDIAQRVKDGKLTAKGDIEAEVTNRVKQVKETLEAQLREQGTHRSNAEKASDEWKIKYEQGVLRQQITNAVLDAESVANPSALPDILSRAEQVFKVQPDGSIVAKKGDQVIYGADGASPMTAKEWLTSLIGTAPYLGKASMGGGAPGNTGNGNAYGMPQAEFEKLSPERRIELYRESQARKGR
jgi:hypothetical protein